MLRTIHSFTLYLHSSVHNKSTFTWLIPTPSFISHESNPTLIPSSTTPNIQTHPASQPASHTTGETCRHCSSLQDLSSLTAWTPFVQLTIDHQGEATGLCLGDLRRAQHSGQKYHPYELCQHCLAPGNRSWEAVLIFAKNFATPMSHRRISSICCCCLCLF